MLSNVLSNFLDGIGNDPSQKYQELARDARKKLSHEVKTEACKACEKAGWLATLEKCSKGYEELVFTLGKCGGGVVLQANDLFGFYPPAALFFCSVKDEEDPGHSGRLAGRVSQSQPTDGDGWPRERGI
ncbi:hypothetical protein [Rhodoferax sp.]|uniref:hypothetical protein n=1 Tax=Rhodoferax sp. TaxID=50421 RepID=UPI00274A2807|nr:hypothetical protein [Rhodoferax sp.]